VDDLAVVVIRTSVPECIEKTLQRVIDIPATTVGWIQFDDDFQVTIEWANASRREDRHNLLTEESTPAADERPCSHPPPVMIH
jgi:hypothetical protein